MPLADACITGISRVERVSRAWQLTIDADRVVIWNTARSLGGGKLCRFFHQYGSRHFPARPVMAYSSQKETCIHEVINAWVSQRIRVVVT